MRPELHAYLDGEIGLDELPPELRAEAERWERLATDLREAHASGAPPGLAERILGSLPERQPTWRRALDWAVRPRSIRVSPLAGLAAAAVIALLIVRPWHVEAPPPPDAAATVYVQFVLDAPSARAVAVAGDFTEWSPEVLLEDADGDGVWTGRVAVEPGVHQYMFVVDGTEWMTDPQADRYVDDGFGNRNAVLAVAPPSSRS